MIYVLGVVGCVTDGLVVGRPTTWAADAGIVALLTLAAPFIFRIGVRVDDDGIRVMNMLTSKRFRWNDIDRFELAPAGVYPFAGHVILKSGRDIPIIAITVPRFLTERLKPGAEKPIDELNALLRASRDRSDAPRDQGVS